MRTVGTSPCDRQPLAGYGLTEHRVSHQIMGLCTSRVDTPAPGQLGCRGRELAGQAPRRLAANVSRLTRRPGCTRLDTYPGGHRRQYPSRSYWPSRWSESAPRQPALGRGRRWDA